jgi:hypothetical protein
MSAQTLSRPATNASRTLDTVTPRQHNSGSLEAPPVFASLERAMVWVPGKVCDPGPEDVSRIADEPRTAGETSSERGIGQ